MLRRRKRSPQASESPAPADPEFESGSVRIIRPSESGASQPAARNAHLDETGEMTNTGRVDVIAPGSDGVAAIRPTPSTARDDTETGSGWLSEGDPSDPFGRSDSRVEAAPPDHGMNRDRTAGDPTVLDDAVLDATVPDSTLPDSMVPDSTVQRAVTGRQPLTEYDLTARGHGTDPLLRDGGGNDSNSVATRSGGSSSVRLIIGDDDGATTAAAAAAQSDSLGVVFDPRADGGTASPAVETGSSSPDRRTVVISDDGSAALSAEAAPNTRRGMDPRFRERRRAVRRALGRKRIVGLIAGLGVVLVVLVVAALLASSLFAVRSSDVTVLGWSHADRAQVEAVLDELVGTPVLRVDEARVAEQLEAVAWVESAKVTTKLPNSATVEIAERTPLATFQAPDGRYRIIDRYGRVLDITDGFPVEFVWITSTTPPNLEIGEFAPAGFTAAAELSRNFTTTIRPRVQRIAVEPSGQALVVYLRDGSRVNFGAASDLFSKLVRLETLVTTYSDMTDADIDVSTEETTRASDDLLKIKEAEREREAEKAAAAAEAEAEAAAAEAAENGAAAPNDDN